MAEESSRQAIINDYRTYNAENDGLVGSREWVGSARGWTELIVQGKEWREKREMMEAGEAAEFMI